MFMITETEQKDRKLTRTEKSSEGEGKCLRSLGLLKTRNLAKGKV